MMAFAVNSSFYPGLQRKVALVRKLALAIVVAMGAMVSMPAHAQAPKIGYVNTDRVLGESAAAKAASAKLEAQFKARQAEVNRDEQNLQSMSTKLQRDQATMSPSAVDQGRRDLDSARFALEGKGRALQRDYEQAHRDALQSLVQAANNAIKQVAERNGYDFILQEAVTVNPKFDITDEVIKSMGR